MSVPTTTEVARTITEVARIEDALHALLVVAVTAQRLPSAPKPRAQRFADIVSEMSRQTKAERQAAELLDNPVGEAVRRAVVTLGRRLDELGGQRLMTDVLDRVAERDPSTRGQRLGIVDHRWDGIGTWVA